MSAGGQHRHRGAWAELAAFRAEADRAAADRRWAHFGVGTTADGGIVTPEASGREMLVLGADGTFLRRWPVAGVNPHGVTVAPSGPEEHVWVADNGYVRTADGSGTFRKHPPPPIRGSVTRYTLRGVPVGVLEQPPTVGSHDDYSPTDVVVDMGSARDGTWVSDGYGQHLVHLFDADGRHRLAIDGTQGAGAFRQPHAIHLDHRTTPRLLVADRANDRIQAFDPTTGRYVGCFGQDIVNRPSGLATWGDLLAVAELAGRLSLFDARDRLVDQVGPAPPAVTERPGWPNALDDGKREVRPPLQAGRFNSPHAVATTAGGELVVSEWLIGGRVVRLGPDARR